MSAGSGVPAPSPADGSESSSSPHAARTSAAAMPTARKLALFTVGVLPGAECPPERRTRWSTDETDKKLFNTLPLLEGFLLVLVSHDRVTVRSGCGPEGSLDVL